MMDALSPSLVVLHIASDVGWHLMEYLYYGGSALLLVIAALLIISGRRDRRSFAGAPPDEAQAEPQK